MKRMYWMIAACLLACLIAGCGSGKEEEKRTNLEFTVVSEERLPEEVKKLVDEKKQEVFKITYADSGYLYICVGYGAQETGGYSVTVKDLYATENAIYVDTNLLGPKDASEKLKKEPSYPYLVLKTPFMDKTVVFD